MTGYGWKSTRHLVLVLIPLSLLVAAAVGAAFVGARRPDPVRADLPPAVPSPAASLFTDRLPNGDRASFDATVATVHLDLPEPPSGFRSPRYGYSLEVPGGWTATPARQLWNGEARPDGAVVDAFIGFAAMGAPRLTVAAHPKPAESSEDRFVADVAPLPGTVRTNGPAVFCVFGNTIIERGPIPPWETEVIGGHRASVRSMCGTVDAVVFVGDRGYVFSLSSGRRTVGDIDLFRRMAVSVRFDDGLATFVSDAYGYAIRLPGDWQLTPAKVPWDGTGTANDGMDWFLQTRDEPIARFTVAAREREAGLTEEGWIETYVPRIKELIGKTCRFGSTRVLAPDADASWQPATIDGRDARVRAACGRIEGVVFNDAIGYWLRLSTSERRTGADVASFDRLADTIDLDAVAPLLVTTADQESLTPTKTFASRRYGYTIRYPAGWSVTAAPKPKAGEALGTHRIADEFAEPGDDPRRFSVIARALGGGIVDDAWLGSYVPDLPEYEGGWCRISTGMISHPNPARNWAESSVAGRPARIRAYCGDVQAVISVGDSAYILWLATPGVADSMFSFRQIADTFRLAP